MSEVAEQPTTETGQAPRRRRLVAGLVIVVVAAVGAVVAMIVANRTGGHGAGAASAFTGATDQIVQGDLASSTSVSGTLRYADGRPIQAGRGGIVTWVPAPGAVVPLGGKLYAVDNVPVFRMRGGLPAWREFADGMDRGPDVLELEESLRGLGYFRQNPDDVFTAATTEAIKRWQKANGLESTGRLPLGSVLFSAGDLRIGTVKAHLGDQAGPGGELFDTTATTRIVDATIKLASQQLAVPGTKVTLDLPDGATTAGTMVSVGAPTERNGSGDQKETVIPVVVALDDPAAAGPLQEASVTVEIPSDRRQNVLSVSIGALLAITPQQYGVEVVDEDQTTRQVPVKVGLFAGGRVEISGAGVHPGQRVVVPNR
ncbi:peptidoglycan-binding protein [Amycolatopsis sp. NBRC 101858]|uniref:peptidoglycan-binding protein n=1 Tax=Amycolatopsis sp. NBRC 101858 TaxID=3032200 RepID=UPI0024A10040|nr:peptidoglycan-binding protein [Amycolatopsis sp. NBRC 101858]GLY42874.1 peptidoglycan-binding protein [Amycolatopsis sp. NBRC 101858]